MNFSLQLSLLALSFWLVSPVLAATYQHTEPAFSFDYDDKTWEVAPAKTKTPGSADIDNSMAEKTLMSLQRKEANEKYHSRFSVVNDSLKPFLEKKEPAEQLYRKHALDFLKSQRFAVLSTQTRRLEKLNREVFEIVAHQRDFGLTFKQIIFVEKDTAFILTGATRSKLFKAQEGELTQLFESFRLTPKSSS